MSSKQYVWMPVCERSLIPGVVAQVSVDKKTKKFTLSILHPYTKKKLDKDMEFKTMEAALSHGAKRRLHYKYKLKIDYVAPEPTPSAPRRGKITVSN